MIYNLFLIIVILKGILAQNCPLTAADMSKSWIYAIKPTAKTWDVLHTDYVQDQKSLYYICDENNKKGELQCNHGKLKKQIAPKTCSSPIKSTIVLIANENSCRRMDGQFYQVQYSLPDRTTVPLYKVCYSQSNEHALYARHKSYGFNLAASTYTRAQFALGNVVSRECADSYKAANVYKTFVRLLGTKQKYIRDKTKLVIERGHLANSQDFPTYDQMDATMKYVNVIPQFRGSNRSNWKRIENWIHKLPASGKYAEVVTGSFDILLLPESRAARRKIPMYLMENNKNPIPLWSYKVVKYAGVCYAFVTLNNGFNSNSRITTPKCKSVTCPKDLTFKVTLRGGISYCCNYNHFAREVGTHVRLC